MTWLRVVAPLQRTPEPAGEWVEPGVYVNAFELAGYLRELPPDELLELADELEAL